MRDEDMGDEDDLFAWADGDDGADLTDRLGSIEERLEGDELVLRRSRREDDLTGIDMLRFNQVENLLRVFPKVTRLGELHNQFDGIAELQIEAPQWNPRHHSEVSERYGLLHVVGLPKGFATYYEYGLGIKRDYCDLVKKIEEHSSCTIVRFVQSGEEGPSPDQRTFRVLMKRFEDYRVAVDRSRARGMTAVRRVIDAECHNAVADLFALDPVQPKYAKNSVIRAITEEALTGHVMDAEDRNLLVDEVARAAPRVARETPARFGQLRHDIELVTLEVLIDQFHVGLDGAHARDESHWQRFFNTNRFALQQVFSMPIVVVRQQAHLQAQDIEGRGSRITDFLCANTVTRSALVVEIKTPAMALMDTRAYRGRGGAAVHPPSRDLSGSISQVQSHMESVPKDLAHRLRSTPDIINPWTEVRGAVIAGRVSACTAEQQASFMRYRAGLASVVVLGYDEVLERLKALHEVLKSPPQSDDSVAAAKT